MEARSADVMSERTPGYDLLAKIGSALLAGIVSLTIILNAAFYEQVTSSRIMPVLVGALVVHCCVVPKVFMCREFWMYAAFTAYLFVTLFWTPDQLLAMNSLFPSVDFLIILVVYGSLVAFHDLRAVVIGTLIGFWIGAIAYTVVEGFPFAYPVIFSYNAVAQMYVFGLFYTCLLGWLTNARVLTLSMALLLMAHVLATTSIKTNLGDRARCDRGDVRLLPAVDACLAAKCDAAGGGGGGARGRHPLQSEAGRASVGRLHARGARSAGAAGAGEPAGLQRVRGARGLDAARHPGLDAKPRFRLGRRVVPCELRHHFALDPGRSHLQHGDRRTGVVLRNVRVHGLATPAIAPWRQPQPFRLW